jgi:hypothetical protein
VHGLSLNVYSWAGRRISCLWAQKVHYSTHKSPSLDPLLNFHTTVHIFTVCHPIPLKLKLLGKFHRNKLITVPHHTLVLNREVIIEKLKVAHLVKAFPARSCLELLESISYHHILRIVRFNTITSCMYMSPKRPLRFNISVWDDVCIFLSFEVSLHDMNVFDTMGEIFSQLLFGVLTEWCDLKQDECTANRIFTKITKNRSYSCCM